MTELLFNLTEYIKNIEIPDYERYYTFTAPKSLINKYKEYFQQGMTFELPLSEELKIAIKENPESYKFTKVFIAGLGTIEFKESEEKEIKLQLK